MYKHSARGGENMSQDKIHVSPTRHHFFNVGGGGDIKNNSKVSSLVPKTKKFSK